MRGIRNLISRINVFHFTFALIIVIILIQTVIIGVYWLSTEYAQFNRAQDRIETEGLREKKMLVQSEVNKVFDYIGFMRSRMNTRLKNSIRERTYEACGIADNLHLKYRGRLPDEDILSLIRETLRPIRFNNGRGYYFATDFNGVEQLFADRPELEKKNLLDMKDAKGRYVIRDMIRIAAKSGEGFYKYYWTKPGFSGRDFPKLAFVKKLKQLPIFIGTGEYLDDYERDMKKEILERISDIKYGAENDGYIFVVSYEGITLMNRTQPGLIGKSIANMIDPYGVNVFREERRASRTPHGDFIYYAWNKPSTGKVARKISFVRGLDEWGWMIGTGVYSDDIQNLVKSNKDNLMSQSMFHLRNIILILLISSSIVFLISLFLSRRLKQQFDIFSRFFRKAATSNTVIDKEQLSFSDFLHLADLANEMVTERDKINRDLDRSRIRAEQANKAKNNFLARMSHEIRTPLNAVLGLSDLLLESNLKKDQLAHMKMIRDSSRHLLEIINDLLDFSRIESSRIALRSEDFDAAGLVSKVVQIMKVNAGHKGISLKLRSSFGANRNLRGDPMLIRQILVNLISNAIKYTNRGGVTVKASVVPMRGEKKLRLSVVVEDTGIGIPADKLEIIFESFQQVDDSIQRRQGGIGLGLSISKQLAEFMGGGISVSSRLDRGSVFTLTLPVARCGRVELPRASRALKISSLSSHKPLRVLIAEDNLINARMATLALARRGHSVQVAENGARAIEGLSAGSFDLILMDIEMPEMDGLEATRRIRGGAAGQDKKDIVIIAMTAHVLVEMQEQCFEAGIDGFISKPIHIKKLDLQIRDIMKKARKGKSPGRK